MESCFTDDETYAGCDATLTRPRPASTSAAAPVAPGRRRADRDGLRRHARRRRPHGGDHTFTITHAAGVADDRTCTPTGKGGCHGQRQLVARQQTDAHARPRRGGPPCPPLVRLSERPPRSDPMHHDHGPRLHAARPTKRGLHAHRAARRDPDHRHPRRDRAARPSSASARRARTRAAKSDVRNLVSQMEACFTEDDKYVGCTAVLTAGEHQPRRSARASARSGSSPRAAPATRSQAISRASSGGVNHTFTIVHTHRRGRRQDVRRRRQGRLPCRRRSGSRPSGHDPIFVR